MPRVSVVMAVYNAAESLRATLDSLQSQTFPDWELICIDDGSTDNSLQILRDRAGSDHRIQPFRLEENRGLTRALIYACDLAGGEYLARQDAGDLSLPMRLERQVSFLDQNHAVAAVGPGISRIGPRGERLLDRIENLTPSEVTERFLATGKAIVHAGAMFRKSAYQSAGGYRGEFRVAQDIDLWYRISDFGFLAEIPEVLFAVRIDALGISALNNDRQHALARLARGSYELRRQGLSDARLLEEAAQISAQPRSESGTSDRDFRRRIGAGHYFLGSELFQVRHPGCRHYFWQAALNGTSVARSLSKFLLSFVCCRQIRECQP